MDTNEEREEETKQRLIALFRIFDCLYGIEADRVQEVVGAAKITPVHHAPPFVLGVMNLRGRIITVIDLGIRLGHGSITESPDSRVFIVSWNQEFVGLLVEQADDVIPLDDGALAPPPSNIPRDLATIFHGVFKRGRHHVALLNVDAMLRNRDLPIEPKR